jgi:hypothetical protein
MTYKEEMKMLATDIVKSKGHKVFLDWSQKKKDVTELAESLNKKINKAPGANKVKTTVKPLFTQQLFDF